MSRAKAPQQNQQQQQQQQQQQFAGMNHGGYLGMGGGMRNMGFPALGPESSMGNMAQGGAMRGVGAVGDGFDGWSGCNWCTGNQCVAWAPGLALHCCHSADVLWHAAWEMRARACVRVSARANMCRDAEFCIAAARLDVLTGWCPLSGMRRAKSRRARVRRQVEIYWSCCSPSQNCCP